MANIILRFDPIPTLNVTSSNATLFEGAPLTNTPYNFTVTRVNSPTTVCSATWSVANSGTADANDFVTSSLSGTVFFGPGVTSNVVTLNVRGDLIEEENESFVFTLSDPVNCRLGPNFSVNALILNDELYSNSAPSVRDYLQTARFGGLTLSGPEDQGTIQFGSAASGVAVNADLIVVNDPGTITQATANSWITSANNSKAAFIYANGNLTIPAGVTLGPKAKQNKLILGIYVNGNLHLDGTIMTRGPNHGPTGSAVYGNSLPIAQGEFSGITNPTVAKQGGAGQDGHTGVAGGGSGGDGQTQGATLTTGGGGAGRYLDGGIKSGNGAYGSLFSGGPGGGGIRTNNASAQAANGVSFGGAGGRGWGGDTSLGDDLNLAAGGAGNPAGDIGSTSAADSRGTGGIITLFVNGTLTGNGYVLAEGSDGRSPVSGSGGGGSGGGVFYIMSGNNQSQVSAYANGGVAGAGGGSGGDGGGGNGSLYKGKKLPGKDWYVSAEGSASNNGRDPSSPALLENFTSGGSKARFITETDRINVMNEGVINYKSGYDINKANVTIQAYGNDAPTIDGSYPEFHHGANGTYITSKRIFITNANWLKANSSASRLTTFNDPDGDYKAYKLTDNGTNASHFIRRTVTTTVGDKVAVIWAHTPTGSELDHVYISCTSNAYTSRMHFNVNTGVIATATGQANGWIEQWANNWYKCVMRCANVSTGTTQIEYGVSRADTETSYAGSGNSMYLYAPDFSDFTNPWRFNTAYGNTAANVYVYESTSTIAAADAGDYEGGRFWSDGRQNRLVTHLYGMGALANTISGYKVGGNYFLGWGMRYDSSTGRWNVRMQRPSSNSMNSRTIISHSETDPNDQSLFIYPDSESGFDLLSNNVKIKGLRIQNYFSPITMLANKGKSIDNTLYGGYRCIYASGNNALVKNNVLDQHLYVSNAHISFNDIKAGGLAARWHKLQGIDIGTGNNMLINGTRWTRMFDGMVGGGMNNLTVNNFVGVDIWDDFMQDGGNKYVTYLDGRIKGGGISRDGSGAAETDGGDYNRLIGVIVDNDIGIFYNREYANNSGVQCPRFMNIHGSTTTYRPYQILNCTFVANTEGSGNPELGIGSKGANTNYVAGLRWQEVYNSILIINQPTNANGAYWARNVYPEREHEFWDGLVCYNPSGQALFRHFSNNTTDDAFNVPSGVTSIAAFKTQGDGTANNLSAITANVHGTTWHGKSIDLDPLIDENYVPRAGYVANTQNLAVTSRSGIFSDIALRPYHGAKAPISNNVLSISALTGSAEEGANLTFKVNRTGTQVRTVSATWTVTGNNITAADFSSGGLSNTVYIPAGAQSAVITLPTAVDGDADDPFTITLSAVANATLGTASVDGSILAPALTGIEYIANTVAEYSSTTLTTSHTMSSNIQEGDLLIWHEHHLVGHAWNGTSTTVNVPSGFQTIRRNGSFQNAAGLFYKIADASDIGRTVTGLTAWGTLSTYQLRRVYSLRGINGTFANSVTQVSQTHTMVDNSPGSLTVPAGSGAESGLFLQMTAKSDYGNNIDDPSGWSGGASPADFTVKAGSGQANRMRHDYRFYLTESDASSGSAAFSDDIAGNFCVALGLRLVQA